MSKTTIPTGGITADAIDATLVTDDAISDEHLDVTAVTGQTAITSLADTDKFLVSDASDSGNLKYVENQYLGGGTLVQTSKIFYESTQSTSNVTLVNAFTDDYDFYVMYAALTPVSNNVELRMQFKDNSGNTVSGSNYEYVSKAYMSDGNTTASVGESNAYVVITDGVSSNGSDSPFIGTFGFNINRNHGSTGNMGAFNCHGQYGVRENNSSRRYRAYYHASAYRDSLTNQKARDIKLYFASGNIAQANVRMYGINGSNS